MAPHGRAYHYMLYVRFAGGCAIGPAGAPRRLPNILKLATTQLLYIIPSLLYIILSL